MNLKRAPLLVVLGFLMYSSAVAQTDLCSIQVVGWTGRPPAPFGPDEGYVEIRNEGSGFCFVEVTRTFDG